MKVLWFTNTLSRYANNGNYNGGGWIYSLEKEISKRPDIELAVAFFMNNQTMKIKLNGVTYYPIENPFTKSLFSKIKGQLTSQTFIEKIWLKSFLKVIDDFKPDIIEIFGSEQSFGQVAQFTSIPVVLHIQGILTPCYNAFLPPSISKHNYIWADLSPINVYRRYHELTCFRKNGEREIKMIHQISYFIGRTEWDRRLTKLYNPQARYFYGNEMLRDTFYEHERRELPNKSVFISTLSSPLYKGYGTVLKTANILKHIVGLDFDWKVYGNINPKFTEHKLHLNHNDINVHFMGIATAEELHTALLKSTAYLHLSYIDNSPNSVCEAQITGIPVIATNVGGTSSLIKNGETGFLVPVNDPYQTAYLANQLAMDKELNINIGNNASYIARKKHNKNEIVETLINTYNIIIDEKSISK